MTLDDLIYLVGVKQIQIEVLTKQVEQLKKEKQVEQECQKGPHAA